MATIDLMDQFSHLGEGGIRNNGTLDAEAMFQPSLRTMRTDFIQVKAGDSIVYKNMSGMSSIWNILSFYTGDAQGFYVSGIAGQTTPQSGVWTAQQDGYVRLFGSFPAGDNISVTMTDLAPDVEDYLSQYNAMNYRFLPNSIPKIVAHIQEYLVDHPIADSTTLQAVIDTAFKSYLEEIQETADTYISEAVPSAAAAAVDAAAAPALAEITAKTAEAAESARQAGLSQQSAEMSEENALTYRNQAQQIKDSISAEVAASVLAAQEQATLAQESAQAADESADTAEQFVAQARAQAEAAADQAQNASGFAQNASDFADNAAQSAATFSTDPTLTISGKAADAKATGDQLSELKSAFTQLDETVVGEKNYIENKKLITSTGTSKGSPTDDNNFSISELIPISAMPTSGSILVVDYGTITENTMFALYNLQGAFLDSWGLQSSSTSRAFTFSYASYTDLAYVRFAFQKGYSAKITSQNGTVTYWSAQKFDGLVNDVNTIKSTVTTLPSTFMQTNTYIDESMVNRLNPSECELNAIVNPSKGSVDSYNGYFTTDFIPIRTGETLYFYRIDTKTIKSVRMFAAYDADKNVISDHGSTSEVTSITQSDNMAYIKASLPYVASDYARTPEDTAALTNANPVYIPGYGNSPVVKTQYLDRHTMWVRSTDTEAQIIQKFVDAFNTGNVDVYFERATYQFVTELAKVNTDYGMIHNEIPIGNGCRYYFNGATLVANIDLTQHPATSEGEFYVNLLGCQRRPSSYELHDGVLIATDTRYVVHDESSALSGSYKHLYQNMEMHYHTNQRQETIRKCIGGGTGASGVVEIIGCKFTTDAVDVCVSYHGNGTDVVGAEFDLNVRDCWFSNGMRGGELSASQTARLFYTGNSAASEPATYDRWTVTKFLNEVRT